jgi:serine protease Do
MNGCRRLAYIATLIVTLLGPALAPPSALAQSQAESLSASFRKAAENVATSVVAIRPIDPTYPMPPGPLTPIGPPRPFEVAARLPSLGAEADREPGGTGVVIDNTRAYVLTNDHILLGASRAYVVLASGEQRTSSKIHRDPGVDLAVLVVDLKGLNLTPAKWGNAGGLNAGDWVLSIGQPSGSGPAISSGIFSAHRRALAGSSPAEEWLETDAAINSVNSGGPLINLNGEVVGINTALVGRLAQVVGMGFAIPAERARRVAADLIEYGRLRRAFLGVSIEPMPGLTAGRQISRGAVVIGTVGPGTPAAEGGLRPGDTITRVAGRPVTGAAMLQALVEAAPIGQELVLTIERGGRQQDLVVRPRAQPSAALSPALAPPGIPVQAGQNAIRGRASPGERVIPRETPAPAPTPTGEDAPALLEPVPVPPLPAQAPSLEPPKNQPDNNPR